MERNFLQTQPGEVLMHTSNRKQLFKSGYTIKNNYLRALESVQKQTAVKKELTLEKLQLEATESWVQFEVFLLSGLPHPSQIWWRKPDSHTAQSGRENLRAEISGRRNGSEGNKERWGPKSEHKLCSNPTW